MGEALGASKWEARRNFFFSFSSFLSPLILKMLKPHKDSKGNFRSLNFAQNGDHRLPYWSWVCRSRGDGCECTRSEEPRSHMTDQQGRKAERHSERGGMVPE